MALPRCPAIGYWIFHIVDVAVLLRLLLLLRDYVLPVRLPQFLSKAGYAQAGMDPYASGELSMTGLCGSLLRRPPDIDLDAARAAFERRILAVVRPLGRAPPDITFTRHTLDVFSAVPIFMRSGKPVRMIAISIGVEFGQKEGEHFIRYAGGSTQRVEKLQATFDIFWSLGTWFADVPEREWLEWTDRSKDSSCLEFSLLNAVNETNNFRSCYNPKVLPETPYNLTIVFDTLPCWEKEDEGLHSGYRMLLPNIAYHLRHGVDQVVVPVVESDREYYTQALAVPISQGSITIVLLDKSLSKASRSHVRDVDNNYFNFVMWFANEAVHRFKGVSRLLRLVEFDEFLFSESWRRERSHKVLSLFHGGHLHNFLAGPEQVAINLRYDWELVPEDSVLRTYRRVPGKIRDAWNKVVVKPDHVAVNWVHRPTNCFGKCIEDKAKYRLAYAHLRQIYDPSKRPRDEPERNETSDLLLERDVHPVECTVCLWRPVECSWPGPLNYRHNSSPHHKL